MKVQFIKHYRKQFNPLNFRLFFNSTGSTKCLHLSFIFMSMAHKWWHIRHSPLWYWVCVCQYLSVQRVMNPRWCVVLQKTQRSIDDAVHRLDVDWLKSGLEQEKGRQEKFPQLEEIWESCPAQTTDGARFSRAHVITSCVSRTEDVSEADSIPLCATRGKKTGCTSHILGLFFSFLAKVHPLPSHTCHKGHV